MLGIMRMREVIDFRHVMHAFSAHEDARLRHELPVRCHRQLERLHGLAGEGLLEEAHSWT